MVTKFIDRAIKYILVALMIVISVLSFYQVITRYALLNPSTWSEEAIRYLFIWASCLGAAIGIKENIHIGIDVIVNLLPKPIRKVIDLLVQVILVGFGGTMCFYGWKLVGKTMNQLSPALHLHMGSIYLAIPAMGVLIMMYAGMGFIHGIKNWKEKTIY